MNIFSAINNCPGIEFYFSVIKNVRQVQYNIQP